MDEALVINYEKSVSTSDLTCKMTDYIFWILSTHPTSSWTPLERRRWSIIINACTYLLRWTYIDRRTIIFYHSEKIYVGNTLVCSALHWFRLGFFWLRRWCVLFTFKIEQITFSHEFDARVGIRISRNVPVGWRPPVTNNDDRTKDKWSSKRERESIPFEKRK